MIEGRVMAHERRLLAVGQLELEHAIVKAGEDQGPEVAVMMGARVWV